MERVAVEYAAKQVGRACACCSSATIVQYSVVIAIAPNQTADVVSFCCIELL